MSETACLTSPKTFALQVKVIYCMTAAEAHRLVDVVVADARSGLIAIDIETAPTAEQLEQLRTLLLDRAKAEGALWGMRQAKAPIAQIAARAAALKVLNAKVGYAETAGLDPHRAAIRLVQLYGGGDRVAVIDLLRLGERYAKSFLHRLECRRLVAHNAAFELAFLAHNGIEPSEMHCTMQAARLLDGPGGTKLAEVAERRLGVTIEKTLQTSDWSAPHLTLAQLEYAAADAVVTWHLAGNVLPRLAETAPAYAIQLASLPAAVRMELRGFCLDVAGYEHLLAQLETEYETAKADYLAACRDIGRADLAARGVPQTPAEKIALLEALLSSEELAAWVRTPKAGSLSTRRPELRRAAHYPPIAALSRLGVLAKQLTTFGPTLAAKVSPVTRRIHAHYGIAATTSGRATCSQPNLQQIPRDKRFRALFAAATSYRLVVADYSSMELRAAAEISGDARMREAFARGLDLHKLTATKAIGKAVDDVTEEERNAAKGVNFGAAYGMGASGLMKKTWEDYSVVLSLAEATAWLDGFAAEYPTFSRWCREHAGCCVERGRIVIGKDATSGQGRIYRLSWLPPGKSAYTRACNLPIQGVCADISMLALAAIDQALFEAGIEGGPVAWLHDEIVLEVPEADAERAADLLQKAMTDAFAETFPGAPLRDLVKAHIGADWAAAKL